MPIIPYIPNSQTSNVQAGEHGDILRIQDVDEAKPWGLWDPNSNSLLYRLMSALRRGPAVHDPVHTWFEDDKPPTYTTVHTECSEVTGTGKTLVITDANVVDNTTLYDETTGEWLRVTDVTTITDAGGSNDGEVTLEVTRGFAGTTATVTTLPVGRKLRIGPTILAEGADANDGTTWQPDSSYQYCTYFSESVKITDVQQNSRTLFGVHTLEDQERITALRMMEQMETQIRYGQLTKTASASDGRNIYLSRGFENLTNINSIALEGAELDWPYLNSQLGVLWEEYTGSSPNKWFICGPTLFDQINRVAYDRWVAAPTFSKTLGAVFAEITTTSGGTLSVVRDNWGFQGTPKKGYIIDMAKVEFREHAGMEMQRREISDPDSHEIKKEIYGSMCPVFHNDELHAVVTWDDV